MRDFSNYKPIDLERPQSNCCGVDVDPDYLICPHCKEHCAIMEPEQPVIQKRETSEDVIEVIIKQYALTHSINPVLLNIELQILKHTAQREQMIEDHKVYMGAIKEEK